MNGSYKSSEDFADEPRGLCGSVRDRVSVVCRFWDENQVWIYERKEQNECIKKERAIVY